MYKLWTQILIFSASLLFANCQSRPGANTGHVNPTVRTWQRLPEVLWLEPSYISMYNTYGLIEEEISYEGNTWISADLDGDGRKDEVGFVLDMESQVFLAAFMDRKHGADTLIIRNEGELTRCCLGAGVTQAAPGEYFNMVSKKMESLTQPSVKYEIYEKSASIYFFDGAEFSSFQISD